MWRHCIKDANIYTKLNNQIFKVLSFVCWTLKFKPYYRCFLCYIPDFSFPYSLKFNPLISNWKKKLINFSCIVFCSYIRKTRDCNIGIDKDLTSYQKTDHPSSWLNS